MFKRQPRAQQSGLYATIKRAGVFFSAPPPAFEEGDFADNPGDTEGMVAATKIVAER